MWIGSDIKIQAVSPIQLYVVARKYQAKLYILAKADLPTLVTAANLEKQLPLASSQRTETIGSVAYIP